MLVFSFPPISPSLKIPIFVFLKFSLSVHNRKILLNFPMNLMPDRGQSVEYSANYFTFCFLDFFNYLFMRVPTFPKKTISSDNVRDFTSPCNFLKKKKLVVCAGIAESHFVTFSVKKQGYHSAS